MNRKAQKVEQLMRLVVLCTGAEQGGGWGYLSHSSLFVHFYFLSSLQHPPIDL